MALSEDHELFFRFKLMPISTRGLARLLKGGVTIDGLPDDFIVGDATYDSNRQAFLIRIHSREFPILRPYEFADTLHVAAMEKDP